MRVHWSHRHPEPAGEGPAFPGRALGAQGPRWQRSCPWGPQWDLKALLLARVATVTWGQASLQEKEKGREMLWKLIRPRRRLLGFEPAPGG